MTKSLLSPQVNENAKDDLQMRQQSQKQYYNCGARPLPPLSQGDVVWYKTSSKWWSGVVIGKHTTLRSYNIRSVNSNILHRNRRHQENIRIIQELPSLPSSSDTTHQSRSSECSEAPTQRVSSYGRPTYQSTIKVQGHNWYFLIWKGMSYNVI